MLGIKSIPLMYQGLLYVQICSNLEISFSHSVRNMNSPLVGWSVLDLRCRWFVVLKSLVSLS